MPTSILKQHRARMVDTISLLISHGLLILAAWRLLSRRDLDSEEPADMDIRGRKRDA